MTEPGIEEQPLSEEIFKAKLQDVLQGHPAKVWLARSVGHRLDVLFAVGAAQGQPVRNFDHLNGFYLLGEGVTPDLVAPLHNLFVSYCKGHRTSNQVIARGHVVDLRYAHSASGMSHQRLTLHMPFNVGAG